MVEVYNAIDSAARTGLSIVLLLWLVSYGTVFEVEYNSKLVEMYKHPWWRMLVGLDLNGKIAAVVNKKLSLTGTQRKE